MMEKAVRSLSVTDEDRNIPSPTFTNYSKKLLKIVDLMQKLNEAELHQLGKITSKVIANKQYSTRKYTEAVSNYQDAISSGVELSGDEHGRLGHCLNKNHQYNDAMIHCAAAVQMAPKKAKW